VDFNAALKLGVDNPTVVIPGLPEFPNFDYTNYLTQNLDFHLTDQKRQAIEKYLTLLKTIV